MAESGFRAAKAWVEVSTDLDASQIDRAARQAAERADATLTSGMERTGQEMSRSLGRAGERGGDNLTKGIDGRLRDARGRFVAAGDRIGEDVGKGIGDRVKRDSGRTFTPLTDGAKRSGSVAGDFFGGEMIRAALPVMAANAPTVGAALAGGIVAGGALGTIGLGIALAVQDPQVKAAAKSTGKTIGDQLKGAAAPFRSELLNTFAQAEGAFARWAPELRGLFADAAPLMRPLTTGLEHMVDEILPGFRRSVQNSEPVVNSLRLTFERLGDATGDMFSDLADDTKGAALGINDVSYSMENLIRTTTKIAEGSAKLREFTNTADMWIDKGRYWIEDNSYLAKSLRDVGVELDLTADGFRKGTPEAEAMRKASLGMAEAADFARLKAAGLSDAQITAADASGTYRGALISTVNNLLAVRGAANGAIPGVRSLGEIMTDFAGKTLESESALNAMEQAIDDATASVKENGKGIDRNIPKQRANREALFAIAAASQSAAAKVRAQTGSESEAAAVTARARAAFLRTAAAMGVERGEAVRLANSLFGIPNVKRDVTVRNAAALAAIKAVKSGIATVRDKSVTVTVKYETRGSIQGEHIIGVGTKTRREGGVSIRAAQGSLRDPAIYTPAVGAPARYAFAEPETGGEAMIPRLTRDRQRALSILDVAAGWHGATVRPQGEGGGTHYHFAAGAIVLDASKIRDVADLARMVASLTPAARSMVRRGASVGSRA